MIYEIIVLNSKNMKVEHVYALEGNIDTQKVLEQTGLASLVEVAISQLTGKTLKDTEEILTLKTGINAYSFKTIGDYVIIVRGTEEKENKSILKKIISSIKSDKLSQIIKSIKGAFKKDSIDEFSSLWG